MSRPLKGATTSWSEAAATSVRPSRPSVGATVNVTSLAYNHTGVVLANAGPTEYGHVAHVLVSYGESHTWDCHFPVSELMEIIK